MLEHCVHQQSLQYSMFITNSHLGDIKYYLVILRTREPGQLAELSFFFFLTIEFFCREAIG